MITDGQITGLREEQKLVRAQLEGTGAGLQVLNDSLQRGVDGMPPTVTVEPREMTDSTMQTDCNAIATTAEGETQTSSMTADAQSQTAMELVSTQAAAGDTEESVTNAAASSSNSSTILPKPGDFVVQIGQDGNSSLRSPIVGRVVHIQQHQQHQQQFAAAGTSVSSTGIVSSTHTVASLGHVQMFERTWRTTQLASDAAAGSGAGEQYDEHSRDSICSSPVGTVPTSPIEYWRNFTSNVQLLMMCVVYLNRLLVAIHVGQKINASTVLPLGSLQVIYTFTRNLPVACDLCIDCLLRDSL